MSGGILRKGSMLSGMMLRVEKLMSQCPYFEIIFHSIISVMPGHCCGSIDPIHSGLFRWVLRLQSNETSSIHYKGNLVSCLVWSFHIGKMHLCGTKSAQESIKSTLKHFSCSFLWNNVFSCFLSRQSSLSTASWRPFYFVT